MEKSIFIPHIPHAIGKGGGKKQLYYQKIREFMWVKKHQSIYQKDEQLKVTIGFYFINRQKQDIDNMLKPIFDSLKGFLYRDDTQIKELHCFVREHTPLYGFDIQVSEITN